MGFVEVQRVGLREVRHERATDMLIQFQLLLTQRHRQAEHHDYDVSHLQHSV
jgi:hypothetical protein